MEEFINKFDAISRHREGYNLKEFAMEYIKNSL